MIIQVINKIAVMGCGWLGLPLAIHLIKEGYHVKGCTTSVEKLEKLSSSGIDPFLVQLNPDIVGDDIQLFLDVDLLIINIPPGRSKDNADDYSLKMQNILNAVNKSPIKKLIFISSTSVYNEVNGQVNETDFDLSNSASALRMRQAENIFNGSTNIDTTVIRMAGLIGPDRHPGRFFAGKENIPNGLSPVNLIHLEDCIGIIDHVIKYNLWRETYNAAAPTHPIKKEFYDLASQKLYGKRAKFNDETGDFKIVDSSKIINAGYEFKHPNLLEWLLQTPQS